MMNRIDAISELYSLGAKAEALLVALTDAQEKASLARLNGWHVMAGQWNLEAAALFRDLERIGNRQKLIIDQLNAAGEIICS